jgi:hypothetical protein
MSNRSTEKGGYPAEIVGYAEPWIVTPGDTVAIKVRSMKERPFQ